MAVQSWLTKVMNLNVYFKEMKELHIAKMNHIRRHPHKVVDVDVLEEEYDTDREDRKNAADDCEHPECHRVICLQNQPKI